MRFASIGSGSRGNGTLVASDNGCVLVDCGFGLKDVELRLRALGVEPADLDGILVTHEHSDHANGVARLARRHQITVYATAGTARQVDFTGCRVELISPARPLQAAGLLIQPVVVPHDARDPVQFVFLCDGRKFGLLTDAGHVTQHMLAAYGGCHALMIECNHDTELLWAGRYPEMLKRRVAGPHGHLNNGQAASFIGALAGPQLQALVLAHLSQQNNSEIQAVDSVRGVLQEIGLVPPLLTVATQAGGGGWVTVD